MEEVTLLVVVLGDVEVVAIQGVACKGDTAEALNSLPTLCFGLLVACGFVYLGLILPAICLESQRPRRPLQPSVSKYIAPEYQALSEQDSTVSCEHRTRTAMGRTHTRAAGEESMLICRGNHGRQLVRSRCSISGCTNIRSSCTCVWSSYQLRSTCRRPVWSGSEHSGLQWLRSDGTSMTQGFPLLRTGISRIVFALLSGTRRMTNYSPSAVANA